MLHDCTALEVRGTSSSVDIQSELDALANEVADHRDINQDLSNTWSRFVTSIAQCLFNFVVILLSCLCQIPQTSPRAIGRTERVCTAIIGNLLHISRDSLRCIIKVLT